MGVQIAEKLPKKQIELKNLARKKIAIDAFNWIFQFLSIIRDRQTGEPLKDSRGRVTSHLSGLFYRTTKLIEAGIKPIYVFDGEPPVFKYVREERKALRQEAEIKWKNALDRGDIAAVRKYAQAASRLTDEMIDHAKKLLEYMGIPVVQAPSEGEAQCALLCKKRIVWSTASQDSDSLLFGSPRLVRNLSITGRRKIPGKDSYYEVKPELIELDRVLKKLKIKKEQLIIAGILIGTDYNPGVKGIGPKRALDLVKKEKTLKKIMKKVKWEHKTPMEKIYNFYLKPPINQKIKPESKNLQPEKLRKFMVDDFEFSPERVDKVINTLKKTKGSLESWLK